MKPHPIPATPLSGDAASNRADRARLLEGVLDTLADGVIVCDERGATTFANAAARRLLGLECDSSGHGQLEDLPGAVELLDASGRPIERAAWPTVRALAGETVTLLAEGVVDARVRRRVDLRVTAMPIRDAAGATVGAIAIFRDISEATELERLKDQFVRVSAHELRTPVAILRGYVQALMRLSKQPPPRRMLEAIQQGVDRIDWIVKALLSASEIEAGRLELALEPTDLAEIVRKAATRIARTAPAHRVRARGVDHAPVVGDRERLQQAVATLVENAIHYSPRGGDIDIEVSTKDELAVVSVVDHGVGIASDKQSRIFQRLYRAHSDTAAYEYRGMGVGLFIARAIVERHGGRMWFVSVEGEGSTFSFSMPLQKPAGGAVVGPPGS